MRVLARSQTGVPGGGVDANQLLSSLTEAAMRQQQDAKGNTVPVAYKQWHANVSVLFAGAPQHAGGWQGRGAAGGAMTAGGHPGLLAALAGGWLP